MNVWLGRVLACLIAVSLVAAGSAEPASAASPTATVQVAMEKAFAVLNDPKLADREQRERLRRAVDPYIDFAETAKRALGPHRPKSSQQVREYMDLFIRLLEEKYLSKVLLAEARGMQVEYLGERVDGTYAQVETRLSTRKGNSYSVTWRMYKLSSPLDSWLVYDWNAGGVSLVRNYRSQFARVLKGSSSPESFANFLAVLRAQLGQTEVRRRQ